MHTDTCMYICTVSYKESSVYESHIQYATYTQQLPVLHVVTSCHRSLPSVGPCCQVEEKVMSVMRERIPLAASQHSLTRCKVAGYSTVECISCLLQLYVQCVYERVGRVYMYMIL